MWLHLPFAQVSRSVEQNLHTTFSFLNPLSESEKLVFGMFKDSAIILVPIRRSFLTKSAAAMFTSVRVDFGRPPLSSSSTSSLPSQNREYHLKTFDRFKASFPYVFYTNTSVSVADRPALKQKLMATFCSVPPSMKYKENWLYRTSCNSYTVEDKQTKLGVWTDIGWYYLVVWPTDRSSFVILKNQS